MALTPPSWSITAFKVTGSSSRPVISYNIASHKRATRPLRRSSHWQESGFLSLDNSFAGPFCGQLLGDHQVEPPSTGDPLRVWRELDIDGTSPWFRSLARNKKSIAIDLRKQEGREIVKRLAVKSDVIVENFQAWKVSLALEKWGLGPQELHKENPSLIFTRVSGYGQTGPWASRPGYASVCEAEPNISLGDSVAGLHAAFGTSERQVLALLSKQKKASRGEQGGETVDVSIMESMLNLMEGIIPEYDRKGKIRGPSGSSVTGIVPTNAYPCLPLPSTPSSPTYIIIGANGDTLYARLMRAIGREDLIGASYAHNHHRVARQGEIEEAISAWTSQRQVEEGASIPVGRVVGVKEIVESEQVKARGAVEDVEVGREGEGWKVKMPRVFPLLEGCDTKTRWAGPDLGAHTEEILGELGLNIESIIRLREEGVIG
ncbi:CoA-transferase family III domain-containing protein [Suillus subalutaceus]|uniref:CoA-transferase family III domain-containing protein n=1 Tax=Suillus subalutaceus TaxID=48586 RepID=UPI001B87B39F|nr:CoA-transferase family III domain-containing protein [Suillus subalutaceus]KAG1829536.1 CoA-transferase family III domain-containing protein [Suillus subalutaceus]